MRRAYDVGVCSEQGRRDYQQDAANHSRGPAGLVAAVAHVGDSWVYRLRAEKLEQLTEDHRDSRHVLTRCLGSFRSTDFTPDVLETDVPRLTTDSVSGWVASRARGVRPAALEASP